MRTYLKYFAGKFPSIRKCVSCSVVKYPTQKYACLSMTPNKNLIFEKICHLPLMMSMVRIIGTLMFI
jgi:hypothetical protein